MKKKTILVTGSAGFIGFHVAKKLLQQNKKVIGLDNLNNYYDVNLKKARNKILLPDKNYQFYKIDLKNKIAIEKIFKSHKIDQVCNLAAQAGVRYSLENPQTYVDSNIVGFVNLLEVMKNNKVTSLIYASSSSVYGGNKKVPFSETDNVDQPISLYAATKKSNEVMAHVYHHLYGFKCTGLRFFTVYGPWGRPDMAYYIFTQKILANKPIEVYNYGRMKRDFTYIDDIVNGVISAVNKDLKFEIINLGNNKTVQLKKFIQILENELGKKAMKKMKPIQPGDVVQTYADIRKAKKILNYQPKTNIEAGLKRFVAWYKKYYGIKNNE